MKSTKETIIPTLFRREQDYPLSAKIPFLFLAYRSPPAVTPSASPNVRRAASTPSDTGPGQRTMMMQIVSGGVVGLVLLLIVGAIAVFLLIKVLGLGTAKEAAACGAIFIWLNSASGLVSRLQFNAIDLGEHVPLIVAVVLGGVAGSFLGSVKYSPRTMEKILGIVILIAIVLLLRKVLFS